MQRFKERKMFANNTVLWLSSQHSLLKCCIVGCEGILVAVIYDVNLNGDCKNVLFDSLQNVLHMVKSKLIGLYKMPKI